MGFLHALTSQIASAEFKRRLQIFRERSMEFAYWLVSVR